MTYGEIRDLLERCDPRQLRIDAGISISTVCRALSLPARYVTRWERKEAMPVSYAGLRWLRFTAGLERHAQVTAELAREWKAA